MKKRKKLIGAIISAIIVLALIAGAVYLITHRELIADGGFDQFIQNIFHKNRSRNENIYFDVYSESTFATLTDSLAVASDAGISVFDASGQRTATYNIQLRSPHIASGKRSALVWVSGSEEAYLAGLDSITPLKADGAVIGAKMNSEGMFVVCAEDTGYKAAATVYDAAGTAVYKWYSGEGYLIDAAVSENGQRLIVSTLTDSGARLVSFALDNETPKGEFIEEGSLYLETAFLSDSRVCAMSENALRIFPFSLSSSDVYDFSGEYLKNYTFDGSGFAALLLGKYRTGNQARLVTVGADGRENASVELDREVLSMSAAGSYVAVAFADNTVTVYNDKLTVVAEKDELIGLRGVYVRPDGTAVAVTATEAFSIGG